MAYNEIINDGTINGIPIDQSVISFAVENQKYLKSLADENDDLSFLSRSIIPSVDNEYEIGSDLKKIKRISSYLTASNAVSLNPGLGSSLSVRFSDSANTGFYSSSPGFIDFISGGYRALSINSSKIQITAANNTQLAIEGTQAGKEALHTIGADSDGMLFRNFSLARNLCLMNELASTFYQKILTVDGDESSPAYSFLSNPQTGFFHIGDTNEVGLSINGLTVLQITNQLINSMARISLPSGSTGSPSITFAEAINTGLYYDPANISLSFAISGLNNFFIGETEIGVASDNPMIHSLYVTTEGSESNKVIFKRGRGTQTAPQPVLDRDLLGEVIFNGVLNNTGQASDTSASISSFAIENYNETSTGAYLAFDTTEIGSNVPTRRLDLGNPTFPQINMMGSFGGQKKTINTPGTYNEENIQNFSILKVDTSTGDIILNTLGGGVDTQLLFIFKSDPAFTLTIAHNNAAAGQKIMTQNQTNLVLGAGYGGATFINDEGTWKEISIS